MAVNYRNGIVAVTAVAVGLVAFAYRYLSFSDFANDHFVYLATAQQVLLGALPVRDYVEMGTPLMTATSALAQVVLGTGVHSELLMVCASLAIAAMLSVLVATWLSGSLVVATIGALVTILVHPMGYAYPKLLVYAFAFTAAWGYATRPTSLRLWALAVITAVGFLFRHDHGVILGIGFTAALVARHPDVGELRRVVPRFAVASALLIAPYVLWVQVHEGLDAYVADGVAFYRREVERADSGAPPFAIDRTRPLISTLAPLPVVEIEWIAGTPAPYREQREVFHRLTRLESTGPRAWRYALRDWSSDALRRLITDPSVSGTSGIDDGALRLTERSPGVLARLPGPGEGLRFRDNAVATVFYLVWLLPFASALALAAAWQKLPEAGRAVAVMAIIVQVLMNRSMLRDPLDKRVADVVIPAALLLSFLVSHLCVAGASRALCWLRRCAAVVMLAVSVVASAAIGSFSDRLDKMNVADGLIGLERRAVALRRELAPPHERTGRLSPGYRQLVDYVRSCSPAGARLFAPIFAPELFFYTGCGFAGGQPALIQGYYAGERHSNLMLARLAREDVPFVILDSDASGDMARNHPRVMAHVNSRYREVGRFEISRGKDLIVLADNARIIERRIGASGLPCYTPQGEQGNFGSAAGTNTVPLP